MLVSEEKKFEYYGIIHVYCPRVGAYEPLGPFVFFFFFFFFFFSESLIFNPYAHFLQDFHLKGLFKSFPHSNALATYVDLVVK